MIPRRRRDGAIIPPCDPAGASPSVASGRDHHHLAPSPSPPSTITPWVRNDRRQRGAGADPHLGNATGGHPSRGRPVAGYRHHPPPEPHLCLDRPSATMSSPLPQTKTGVTWNLACSGSNIHLLIVECPLSIPVRSSFLALVAAANLVVLVAVIVSAREESYCLPARCTVISPLFVYQGTMPLGKRETINPSPITLWNFQSRGIALQAPEDRLGRRVVLMPTLPQFYPNFAPSVLRRD